MSILPKEIGYDPALPSLPADTSSSEIVLQPVNTSTASSNQLIEFQLPSKGFMVPGSLYIRYKATITNGTGGNSNQADSIKGCPVYSFFNKLETYAGSQNLETQNEYGMMMNDLVNCTMSTADKYGLQPCFGWTINTSATVNTEQFSLDSLSFNDYLNMRNNTTTSNIPNNGSVGISLSAPIQNVLSNAEKLVPLEFMPNVILRLTTDSASNFITAGYSFVLSNIELCYTAVNFNSDVLSMVQQMGGDDNKIYLKSSSWALSGNSFNASTGSRELQYSHRFASIRAIFAHFVCGSGLNINGKFDSVAPEDLNAGGTYQFTINSIPYPMRELSTNMNKTAVLMELRKSFGSISSKQTSMSINSKEFSICDSAPTTTNHEPAKFIVGVDTSRLASDSLLTGVSSQNSNVTLRINSTTAHNTTAYCYVNYDELLEIDPMSKTVTARY